MHPISRLALVLLAAAVPTAGAAQGRNPADDLTAIYDRATRLTRVSVFLRHEPGTPSVGAIHVSFQTSHPDTVPARPMEAFELSVVANVRHPRPPRFTGVDEAVLVVDDSAEIRLAGEHLPGTWSERLTFPVSHAQAFRLGAAHGVQGRIGPWEFRLAPEEVALIGRLLAFARLDPAAPVPRRVTVFRPGELCGTGRVP